MAGRLAELYEGNGVFRSGRIGGITRVRWQAPARRIRDVRTAYPEQARVRAIAELMALPGPKPVKPIPPEILAEILADDEPAEETVRQIKEMIANGGYSFAVVLAEFDQAAGIAK